MDPPRDPEREPMPQHLKPMLATLSTRLPPDEEALGVRDQVGRRPGDRLLRGRTPAAREPHPPRDHLALSGAARAAAELGPREAVLDGEVVAFDEDGRPSFERLQGRMNLASEAAVRRRMADRPVTYMVFDLLYLDGRSLVDLPYTERRERLEELELDGPNWQTPSHHRGEGKALLQPHQGARPRGPGRQAPRQPLPPGPAQPRLAEGEEHPSQELVIGGWLPGQGRREGTIGAILVGYYEDGTGTAPALRRAGRQRLHRRELERLAGLLEPLRTQEPLRGPPAPKQAVFVEPQLVAEVAFREWTAARTLRAPVYKGLRADKDPAEVVSSRSAAAARAAA